MPLPHQIYSPSTHHREGMDLLEYRVMPSLRDVAHDGVLCTFSNRSAPHPSVQAVWAVHHVQNHTLLGHSPPARRATVLGQPSSVRLHCYSPCLGLCALPPPPTLLYVFRYQKGIFHQRTTCQHMSRFQRHIASPLLSSSLFLFLQVKELVAQLILQRTIMPAHV
jgi:hypothetical protein